MLRLLKEALTLLWEPCDHNHPEEAEDPLQASFESGELDGEFLHESKVEKDKDKSSSNCLTVVGKHMKPSQNLHNCLEQYQKKMRNDYMMSYITY